MVLVILLINIYASVSYHTGSDVQSVTKRSSHFKDNLTRSLRDCKIACHNDSGCIGFDNDSNSEQMRPGRGS